MKIKIVESQSIIDVVLNYYGTIEPLFNFVKSNSLGSIDVILLAGQEIEIDETLIGDSAVVNYFNKNNFLVATSDEIEIGDFNEDFNNDFNI